MNLSSWILIFMDLYSTTLFTVFSDGLGFNPGEIGAVLGLSAVPLLLLNAYVFPLCARKFGIKKVCLFFFK